MADGGRLLWGHDVGDTAEIRGRSGVTRDRHGVVKFPKSLCEVCNNQRSQPFDNAYEIFARYVDRARLRISPGVNFQQVFGAGWERVTLNLAGTTANTSVVAWFVLDFLSPTLFASSWMVL